MKKDKLIYWATTIVIGCSLLYSALLYLTNDEMKQGFVHLGFPNYFRIELAICQMIACWLLIMPSDNIYLKITVYAGLFFTFGSAAIAHACVGDSISTVLMPLFYVVLLLISLTFYAKLRILPTEQ
ncbi:DoxX family protein [Pseudochryseolinea flava]|uniref:DoxX family protein n=1 Tax=Pseudochryseolinea flava TaxID=2059302 RepID=A0A364Y5N2_9BACT|nr:DoxX family protein [Pseudochryseolinea flava]RAW02179.1 DoxX family protein [Pseudochryseolinea flava]